eukprot:gnl/TRDRNA2_/TRDRNA2_175107_c0_seq6.p1 gnl/TRDRNA2_/TRDRNA2_175107_c0~~gnl/TRDRNA2_/TRDRNA2_175107_c0_seq6.p1  ORF type:complete len:153 (+),score=20.54 gnl/TRDRNA2_/TRDRNA2_175107_c0_seq6:73-531(+)
MLKLALLLAAWACCQAQSNTPECTPEKWEKRQECDGEKLDKGHACKALVQGFAWKALGGLASTCSDYCAQQGLGCVTSSGYDDNSCKAKWMEDFHCSTDVESLKGTKSWWDEWHIACHCGGEVSAEEPPAASKAFLATVRVLSIFFLFASLM